MVHHNSCPLCLSDNLALRYNCTDSFFTGEAFQIIQCQACGFEFTQDYPDENEIGRYYESEDYISHSNTSKGLENNLYQIARNFMLRRKRDIIKKVTGLKTGQLLDIGSGTGHFADTMKSGGWQVKGIEVNEKARNFAKSNFGLEIYSPEEIAAIKSGSIDCITLWHVLEHFHDPYKYASEIHRILKPGGICVIALPNSSSYDAFYYKEHWAAYDVPRHLWHFNPDTFRLFAEKTGFKLKELKSLPLDVFYISTLSEKYIKSYSPFIRGMFRATLFAFHAIFSKERSSSIIYILRK